MPPEGIYVVLIRPSEKHSIGERIKFSSNRHYFFISEILDRFGINKLTPGDQVWIKKNNEKTCGGPFGTSSTMPWVDFDKCVIVLCPEKPPDSIFINNNAYTPEENNTYEHKLEEQIRLWKAKKEKKEERGPIVSRAFERRNQAKYIVIKRKRKQRREAKMQKSEAKTEENKKDPGD